MIFHTETQAATERQSAPKLLPKGNWPAFVLVTGLFFLWGIPNNLNDVLIKQFMKSFEITRFKAGLVQSAFYTGYFVFSMPAAFVMRRFGYKSGLVMGLFLYCTGTFLFWPAANVQSYAVFLFALFVIASGLGFLETGANPFIAQLGPADTSERRLNFSQSFNPLGSVTGLLIGTLFIFSGIELKPDQILAMKSAGLYNDYLRHETLRVIRPYMVLCAVVFCWALLIIRTKFPVIAEEARAQGNSGEKGRFLDLFHYPHFLKAVIAQFCYVGAQVGTWSYFIQYAQDYIRVPEKTAGYLLIGSLVAFGTGRFVATYLMKFVQPRLLMGAYALANVTLVAIAVVHPGWGGVWSIFFTSFFMSLMFPTIFALGLKGLGPNTKIASSLIVMAIIGGGVFTPAMGLVFQATRSMALAMTIPLACYLFVAYYAYVGSVIRQPEMALVPDRAQAPSME
ncbi:MAG TPA: L-fucose:H+ symporter permease [Terriglobales bacterium]|nr:L-fucose:H+ symporter permease [Terriglobales bacterium]